MKNKCDKKMDDEWEDPNKKESHKGKTVAQHIDEVKKILRSFLEFYKFEDKYLRIGDFLAEFHDKGKLHIDWGLGEKKGHSHYSYQYMLNKNEEVQQFFQKEFSKEKIELLLPILQFLVLKHHSPLSKKVSFEGKKIKIKNKKGEKVIDVSDAFSFFTEEKLNEAIKVLGREELINIVDVFGLFKIADSCSASNHVDVKLEQPEISDEVVRSIIGEKVDSSRWSEQLTLSSLPNIGILRAYTGWGKTSAGITFFKNKKPFKIFYLMPTITAINTFCSKLEKAIGKDKVLKYFYFLDTELKENEEDLSDLFLYENFVAPYVVTTIDQFLLSFLQVGRYYTKRVGFRNAGLIIDEVHLLNPLMLELLTYFIDRYQKLYNLKILFMSASLPNYLKDYLNEKLKIEPSGFRDFSLGYKKLKRVMWEFNSDEIENHLEDIIKEKEKGKKVLVIVNTVEKANTLGKKLEKEYNLQYGKDFIVFHARFMYKDRIEKEKWIAEHNMVPHILIATQVCEVSLDISYDVLFTELAPLPAIIQRFGRVNRYGQKTESTNCYIFDVNEKEEKTKYPYSDEDLSYARKICKELQGENLKNEKQIIDELDKILDYENFKKEIKQTLKKTNFNIPNWEYLERYFYSFEIDEREITNILNYRESFTTMILPDPNMVEDEDSRTEITNLTNKDITNFSFEERRRYIAQLKELTVPVPIWLIKSKSLSLERGFPFVNIKGKRYNKKYGIFELELEDII